MQPLSPSDVSHETEKRAAAEAALPYVNDGDVVGLGTGSTVKYFLLALGERVKSGFRIQGVPTSRGTAVLAQQLNIPLLPDDGEWTLDVAIDGADQVDSHMNLIKGGGGALLREKIVASAARQFIVIIDSAKRVLVLGKPVPLPLEVLPFGWPTTSQLIRELGLPNSLRFKHGEVFRTDNGNFILDIFIDRIDDPKSLETTLNGIPGVVDNGLFVGRTSTLITGTPQGVEVKSPPHP